MIAFPSENSDITANAFLGQGGNVKINTNALLGIKPRSQLTPLSDITASSELGLQGEININTIATDPTQGLNNLPQEQMNMSFETGCDVSSEGKVSFYDLGLGGFPVSADDLFSADTISSQWVDLEDITPSDKTEPLNISSTEVFPNRFFLICQ